MPRHPPIGCERWSGFHQRRLPVGHVSSSAKLSYPAVRKQRCQTLHGMCHRQVIILLLIRLQIGVNAPTYSAAAAAATFYIAGDGDQPRLRWLTEDKFGMRFTTKAPHELSPVFFFFFTTTTGGGGDGVGGGAVARQERRRFSRLRIIVIVVIIAELNLGPCHDYSEKDGERR